MIALKQFPQLFSFASLYSIYISMSFGPRLKKLCFNPEIFMALQNVIKGAVGWQVENFKTLRGGWMLSKVFTCWVKPKSFCYGLLQMETGDPPPDTSVFNPDGPPSNSVFVLINKITTERILNRRINCSPLFLVQIWMHWPLHSTEYC